MGNHSQIAYLGILSAPTQEGRHAVAVALSGAAELYHLVDAGIDTSSDVVRDWLWAAGINPEEAATALPGDVLIREILVPSIGSKPLVIHHGDMDIPFVDSLHRAISRTNSPPIVSGLDLTGPIAQAGNGAAGRRAFALQARYEAAIDEARKCPAVHRISGALNEEGQIAHLSISGPFAQRSWTLERDDDAFLLMINIMHIGSLATFVIDPGPAQEKLRLLAAQVGLDERLAA